MTEPRPAHRLRSFGWFLLAAIYSVFAHQFAIRAAAALAPGWFSLASRLLLVLLLLAGFGAMAALGQRSARPAASVGLPSRPSAAREWALGAALGWAGVVVCVLPVALTGGLLVRVARGSGAGIAEACLASLLALAAATLADELLFRGYPFQRLIEAVGPTLATIFLTILFAAARTAAFPSAGGVLSSLLLGFLLAMAYLRTRALWVGWGLHFAWNATIGLFFGLPISGSTEFSPLFATYTTGPAWLTGGGYGPEGSAFAVLVLLLLLPVLSRTTRELRHRWAFPEIIAGGIQVDIDAISRRQHEEGMGPAASASHQAGAPGAAGSPLVQILPAAPPASVPESLPKSKDPSQP